MSQSASKTEHAGPKKGSGAYWGRKAAAKQESNRQRWETDKAAVLEQVAGQGAEFTAPDKEAKP